MTDDTPRDPLAAPVMAVVDRDHSPEHVTHCIGCRIEGATRPSGDEALRAALKGTLNALALTVTNIEPTPHWCRFVTGSHDATCSGMLKLQADGRAALATRPAPPDVEEPNQLGN